MGGIRSSDFFSHRSRAHHILAPHHGNSQNLPMQISALYQKQLKYQMTQNNSYLSFSAMPKPKRRRHPRKCPKRQTQLPNYFPVLQSSKQTTTNTPSAKCHPRQQQTVIPSYFKPSKHQPKRHHHQETKPSPQHQTKITDYFSCKRHGQQNCSNKSSICSSDNFII
jgi:hypothetical protein